MNFQQIVFKAMAALFLIGAIGAAVYTLLTGGTVQDAGLCLIIGAACAAWFQSE